ncbi:aldose epimerase family protein [Zobellia galactanivorans]|uniref:Aldose 1-epimerase n=1 Tax=Zobellia galactanivorans (strain DSM 12802 / CCUG 47099 / CIP 106680 / NCIMB 13871 / Dsij) TaxID=63186 RepID=G0KZN1_ZOBGA|nr:MULTISPECIES: aldose epimerase family protein [Zobellia]MBU3025149.1 galactose mutarotase [Zobellia galactanivorans]MDO6810568.1 aldose epimerase family protein [Zobellia galactanivorans]OWW25264.1 galactose mutarotase [Zobellia sp. OII3]CAZ97078.1 Aldose 1-epimerase [Zobellia galactanivorans]
MKQVTIQTENIILIVLDYGAVIQKLLVKDKDGNYTNVVVGLDYPSAYPQDKKFMGACVGRYAGRISKGGFVIDRQNYPLHNINGVHLHGGKTSFAQKTWKFEEVNNGPEPFVKLSYFSKHLEEGYPGNLKVVVTYKLSGNALVIDHQAITDRTTVINLTNHSYFKLDDTDSLAHYNLQLNCTHYTEATQDKLPTGQFVPVKGNTYDFLSERPIGNTRFDIPFAIHPKTNLAARVSSKKSGISMTVKTNQPALIVYTPPEFTGICFETQNFPDAPNQPSFPSALLRPNEKYRNISKYEFALI